MDHGAAVPPKKKKKGKAVAFAEPAAPAAAPEEDKEEEVGWGAFCDSINLDRRLARAVAQLGWTRPSLVQKATLPVALGGRDCLIRARTGSGKTACYALPVLQRVLQEKASAADARKAYSGVRALVLLPTRELVAQARRQLLELAAYCRESVTVVALRGDSARDDALTVQQSRGDVVCATPAAAREACEALLEEQHPLGELGKTCKVYVIDEADLVLGFGYDEDVGALVDRLQSISKPQGILLSATLGADVRGLKELALRKAATISLDEASGVFGGSRDDEAQLAQYYVGVNDGDKDLVTYVMLKLGLLSGRGVLFVNSVDRCYKLKLFLDLFSIRTLVLNAELPLASRLHAIEAYNRGYYDLLVATDASVEAVQADEEEEDEQPKSRRSSKQEATVKADEACGVARGIDFRDVKWVLNVDLPETPGSYTHRVGRTARAGARGTALSLVSIGGRNDDSERLAAIQAAQPPRKIAALRAGGACDVVAALDLGENGGAGAHVPQPARLAFDAAACEPFRYRVSDVSRGVTSASVREARAAELRREMLNSEALKDHFEANPGDLAVLTHDRAELHIRRDLVAAQVRHVPSYLVPPALAAAGAAPKASFKRKKRSDRGGAKRRRGDTSETRRKDNDPLQTFDSAGLDGAPKGDDIFNEASDEDEAAEPPRVFDERSPELDPSQSTAGRVAWKKAHRKGGFKPGGPKRLKKFSKGRQF